MIYKKFGTGCCIRNNPSQKSVILVLVLILVLIVVLVLVLVLVLILIFVLVLILALLVLVIVLIVHDLKFLSKFAPLGNYSFVGIFINYSRQRISA